MGIRLTSRVLSRRSGSKDIAHELRGKLGGWVNVKAKGRQKWIGYEATKAETEPIAFRQTGDQLELILEENPFYAESGGQVSDTGVVKGDGWELTVEDVEKVDGKSAVVGTFGEPFEPTVAIAQVNETRRRNIERNHTATHLVHAALRKILGTHVRQAGSVVAPERLRFDFSHHGPVKGEQLAAVEAEVNARVWENLPIETREMAYKDAIAAGAMALFGEKYGEVVHVQIRGVDFEIRRVQVDDKKQVAMMSDAFTLSHPGGVSVVVSGSAAKPSTAVTVGIGNDLQRRGLLQANEVVQFIA